MGWDRHKLLWDGMGQKNMSHGQAWVYRQISLLCLLATMPLSLYYTTFDRPKQNSIENIGVANLLCHPLISVLCHMRKDVLSTVLYCAQYMRKDVLSTCGRMCSVLYYTVDKTAL